MNTRCSKVFVLLMFLICGYASAGFASETALISNEEALADVWDIKRQVLSRPDVLLDLANMAESGYRWSNDVVWRGDDLQSQGNWFVAGFLFEREGYKRVWLQYSFTLDESSGKVSQVRRWFGESAFR